MQRERERKRKIYPGKETRERYIHRGRKERKINK
jgi:hypothetical protein